MPTPSDPFPPARDPEIHAPGDPSVFDDYGAGVYATEAGREDGYLRAKNPTVFRVRTADQIVATVAGKLGEEIRPDYRETVLSYYAEKAEEVYEAMDGPADSLSSVWVVPDLAPGDRVLLTGATSGRPDVSGTGVVLETSNEGRIARVSLDSAPDTIVDIGAIRLRETGEPPADPAARRRFADALRDAREAGRTAGRAAGSDAADGNTDPDAIRETLRLLADGDPAVEQFLPSRPDLSGEWSGDPTPASLIEDYLYHGEPEDADLEDADALADAWEEGVSETFEAACEETLRGFLPDPEEDAGTGDRVYVRIEAGDESALYEVAPEEIQVGWTDPSYADRRRAIYGAGIRMARDLYPDAEDRRVEVPDFNRRLYVYADSGYSVRVSRDGADRYSATVSAPDTRYGGPSAAEVQTTSYGAISAEDVRTVADLLVEAARIAEAWNVAAGLATAGTEVSR